MIKCKIKKGDTVLIISGKDKKKTGEVLQVLPKESRVIVQGVNVVKRHTKPGNNDAGGIIEKELPVHISNVAVLSSDDNKPTRIGYKILDGKKVRFMKKNGNILN